MTQDHPVGKKKKSWKLRWIIGIFLSLCFCILFPEVVIGFFEIGARVLFGWVGFLKRVSYQIEYDPRGVAIGVTALVLLIFGVHRSLHRYKLNGSWTVSHTVRSVLGVIGIFLGGIFLVGLGHELAWTNRSPTPWFRLRSSWDDSYWPRQKSKSQLRDIGIAVHLYHDAYRSFPAGGGFHDDGIAEHGWMTLILPHMNQAALYQRIQFSKPWHHGENRTVFETRIPEFEDPRVGYPEIRPNDYAPAFYAANDRVLNANFGLPLSQITDGTSTTIFAGEVKERIQPWGDVTNWRNLDLGLDNSPDGFGSHSERGITFLMADGSVRYVSKSIDPKTLRALATPNARDSVEDF